MQPIRIRSRRFAWKVFTTHFLRFFICIYHSLRLQKVDFHTIQRFEVQANKQKNATKHSSSVEAVTSNCERDKITCIAFKKTESLYYFEFCLFQSFPIIIFNALLWEIVEPPLQSFELLICLIRESMNSFIIIITYY